MCDKKIFWNNILNFIIYNMYNLYLHELFLNFFIWNIKISNIFFNFSGLTWVNLCNPGPNFLTGSTPRSGLITMTPAYMIKSYELKNVQNIQRSPKQKNNKFINFSHNTHLHIMFFPRIWMHGLVY